MINFTNLTDEELTRLSEPEDLETCQALIHVLTIRLDDSLAVKAEWRNIVSSYVEDLRSVLEDMRC